MSAESSDDRLAQMIGRAVAAAMSPLETQVSTLAQRVDEIDAGLRAPLLVNEGKPLTDDERALLERHGVLQKQTIQSPPSVELKITKAMLNGDGSTAVGRIVLPNNVGTMSIVFDGDKPPYHLHILTPTGQTAAYRLLENE